jgi:hypothetical protein
VDVVERQLAAYNARDLEAFVACYADPVPWRTGLQPPAPRSHTQLRADFGRLFAGSPSLHARIVHRVRMHPWVVDHEHVGGLDGRDVEAVVVYRVEADLIVDVAVLLGSQHVGDAPQG